MAPPSKFIWTIFSTKSDGQHFKKDKKFGVEVDQTKWRNGENLEKKRTKMRAIAE